MPNRIIKESICESERLSECSFFAREYQQEQKEFAYHVYVTDSLKLIAENTAKYAGGIHLTKRWADIVEQKPADTRTGAEIARDVIKAAGLVIV